MRGGGEGRGWGWRHLDGRDDILDAVADVLVDVAEDLLLLGQVLALELGHDSAAADVGEVGEPQLPVLERVQIKCRIPNHLVRGDAEVRSCPEDNLALEGDADLDLEHTATICGARCRGTGKTGASPRGAGESGAHLGFQSSLRKRYDVGAGTLTGIVSTMEVTRS